MAQANIAIESLLTGDRRALAKAITLLESSLQEHQQAAQTLLEQTLPHAGKSIRVGISGSPGVGKSTFIEALGLHLVSLGKSVAVLAVDPSSPVAGGSILGDKTRMEYLAREPNAYIRPSPSSGALGGVAQKTRETMLLCEASGFDVVLVETVGVGQSEYQVAGMVDFFLVLMQPNAGDELQGIKKGIVELADALVINKADGNLAPFAEQAKGYYQQALDLVTHSGFWQPQVMTCSAAKSLNIDSVWNIVMDYCLQSRAADVFQEKRSQQNREWMNHLFLQMMMVQVSRRPGFEALKQQLQERVVSGRVTPMAAAQQLANFNPI
jgi:LAO/AO transport system kinase